MICNKKAADFQRETERRADWREVLNTKSCVIGPEEAPDQKTLADVHRANQPYFWRGPPETDATIA